MKKEIEDKIRQTHINMANPKPQDESQKELFSEGDWYIGGQNSIRSHIKGQEDWMDNIICTYTGGNKNNAALLSASPDMYRALKEVALIISSLINKTPTGKERNYLCDLNIKLLSAINKANNRNENNT